MSDEQDLKHFPDLSNKLAAPTKKSLFERQRAEAEAKKVREEAETAAVYNDFVKSFDDEDEGAAAAAAAATSTTAGRQKLANILDSAPPKAPSGPSGRHFVPRGKSSGPGSLGPTPNLSRKRALDGSRREEQPRDKGLFAFEDTHGTNNPGGAFETSDNEVDRLREGREAEKAAAKPTLQLSSLPPGTSPAVIKSLIAPLLAVEGVRVVPPAGPGSSTSTERKSMSAIVTLAQDTPATDIDTAVNSLQNRYLGWGFNLSISRHLSSAALGGSLGTSMPAINSGLNALPFNAQAVSQGFSGPMNRAPPPETHRGGIAPPSSYAPQGMNRGPPPVQVRVNPPSDIKQLQLIHKTVELLITHGPEFEALLMSRPQVQREDKWAWIWNPRSRGGIYYRWRLWEVLTGISARSRTRGRPANPIRKVFESGAAWTQPDEALPFEFTTRFDEFISEDDYSSSDEEDSGDEGGPRKRKRDFEGGKGPPPEGILNQASEEQSYLNPLQKAKLTHLLARLPTTTARLRKGDVARVTAFAISHAGQGAEEVVDMLVLNILKPLCLSRYANPELSKESAEGGNTDSDGLALDSKDEQPQSDINASKQIPEDSSGATLIALHLMSDILSASSTSGVRHAWRYRALFEAALTSRKMLAYLGRLEKILKWGRLRAEKWKRSINNILQLWEGWCVFPASTQEKFVDEFNNPPLTKEEEEEEVRDRKQREKSKQAQGSRSKWKAVDVNEKADEEMAAPRGAAKEEDIDGEPMDEDVDGAPMEDLEGAPMEDLDGAPMDEDVDGAPMDESLTGLAMDGAADEAGKTQQEVDNQAVQDTKLAQETAAAKARKGRPKAEDMFADSDED